jgi:hypothetical protein
VCKDQLLAAGIGQDAQNGKLLGVLGRPGPHLGDRSDGIRQGLRLSFNALMKKWEKTL